MALAPSPEGTVATVHFTIGAPDDRTLTVVNDRWRSCREGGLHGQSRPLNVDPPERRLAAPPAVECGSSGTSVIQPIAARRLDRYRAEVALVS
jgi:hypothetical protein